MNSSRRLSFAVVCLLWAGIVIGISFAEAEKFHAPTLTRSAAFDVGRTVFHAWQRVQMGLVALALVSALAGQVPRWAWNCLGLACAAFAAQSVWIFPTLEARAQTIIAGGVPTAASPHAFYVLLEVLKLVALVTAAVLSLQPPRRIPAASGPQGTAVHLRD